MSTVLKTKNARGYADHRFRHLDQRIVHALESRAVLRYTDELLPEGGSVLDMPAGCGRFIQPLLDRGLEVTAGDAKQDRLDLLAERAQGPVSTWCLRGEALPFDDRHFDAAICVRLLQHLRDRDQRRGILAELARVTRKGVIVTAYMSSPVHKLVHSARRLKRLSRCDHAELAGDLTAAGLRIRRMSRPIPLHAQAVLQAVPTRADAG